MTALWAVLLAFVASADEGKVVDRIAAVVDDEVIALSEIYDIGGPFIAEQCGSNTECIRAAEIDVLDTLILQVLIRHELRKLDLDVSKDELDRSIDQLARDYGIPDIATLRSQVEEQGMTWTDYRDGVREQLRQLKFNEAILRPRISITDDELKDLYKRNQSEFAQPADATLSALTLALDKDGGPEGMVAAVSKAQDISDAVNAGEMSWEDAISEHHSGLFSAKDGAMAPVKQGELMPNLDEVVFATEVGKVSPPVIAGGVVFIVKVLSMESHGVLPYEDVEEQLMAFAYESKIAEQSEQWYVVARKNAAIRVLLEAP